MDPDTIRRLAEQANAEVAAAWLAAMAGIRDARSLSELAALLEAGRIDEAMSVFGPNISTLSRTWNNVFVRAGQETADQVQDALRTAGRGEVVLDFNMVNDGAVRAMQENNLRLVREFTDQQRRATRDALLDGVQRGANPREQARNFRRSIGLTQRQQRAVANFERLLRNNDPAALNRALRDRRFDRTVRRAIETGEGLNQQQINRMVERYRERALKLRAETIARTESLRSVHEGANEMYAQAIEAGASQEQIDALLQNAMAGPQSHAMNIAQLRARTRAEINRAQAAGQRFRTPTKSGDDAQCRRVHGTVHDSG